MPPPAFPTGARVAAQALVTIALPQTDAGTQLSPGQREVLDCARPAELAPQLRRLCAEWAAPEKPTWLVLMDVTDNPLLDLPDAIRMQADAGPDLQWLYSDALAPADDRHRQTEIFQPDLSPRLLRAGYAMAGVLAVRTDCLLGALDLDGAAASALSATNWRQLLPYLLLKTTGSGNHCHVEEAWVRHAARPQGDPALIAPPPPRPPLPAGGVEVSILIITRDQPDALQRCLETVFSHTSQPGFELILVDHGSSDPTACAFIAGLPGLAPDRIRVIRAEGAFNFSALNNLAARHARGRFLLLLNNDTAALQDNWLTDLLDEMNDPGVGLVSPRLVFPDGRLQHAGAVLGLNGAADYPCVGLPMDETGYLGLLGMAREVSAASGAALLIRRELYEQLGGMDERYGLAFGDIDLCLRAAQLGQRCIWTPQVTLMHEAGRTLKAAFASPDAARGAQQKFNTARERLIQCWLPRLARDPAYNVNLSLSARCFEAETNPLLQPFKPSARRPRVLALPADNGGSGSYRVRMPATEAARQATANTRIAPGYPIALQLERLGVDTLFSQRQVDDNHLETLANLRRQLPDLRIVMDFDDLLTGISPHNQHYATAWKDMPRRLEALAALCDCLTVSTAPLAEEMRRFHGDIRIAANGIDPSAWPVPRPRNRPPGAKLRVGWAGGISHGADLMVIRAVVAALANEVDWVFMGMRPEQNRQHIREYHAPTTLEQYPAHLAALDLDLAIAPLESSRFNECKSNLRLLEYGALGLPVIATDITPYRCGLPVTLVPNTTKAWVAAIRERIGEQEFLAREGAALRETVMTNWTISQTVAAWVDAWQRP